MCHRQSNEITVDHVMASISQWFLMYVEQCHFPIRDSYHVQHEEWMYAEWTRECK